MLKDHLGNVRMLLTEETKQNVYPAGTLEGNINTTSDAIYIEKGFFTIDANYVVNKSVATNITDYQNNNGNPPYNNNPNSNTTANSAKLYQMNSGTNKIGLSMSLKVMAGDTLNIFGKSYFYVSGSISGSSSAPAVNDLLLAFVGTPSMTGKGILGSDLYNITQLTTGVSNLMSTQGSQTSNVPKAYINWIFLDERFNYAGGGFDRVGSSGTVKSHSNTSLVAPKNGYVFVFCTNESPHNVFFDNLQVIHSRGPIMEETHYYPFGLTIIGISSRAAGNIGNKYRFGGKERQEQEFVDGSGLDWSDFGARAYDDQIGMWHVIDPLTERMRRWSPYNYAFNNTIRYIDPDGMQPKQLSAGVWSFSGADIATALGQLKMLFGKTAEEKDKKDIQVIVIGGARRQAQPYISPTIARIFNGIDAHITEKRYFKSNGSLKSHESFINTIVDHIRSNYKESQKLIIYGYSYGGHVAQEVTRRLYKLDNKIRISLLVTIDAAFGHYTPQISRFIPGNVAVNRNEYQEDKDELGSYGAPNCQQEDNKTIVINHSPTEKILSAIRLSRINHRTMDEETADDANKWINHALKSK